jgi:outer membrane protein TolC
VPSSRPRGPSLRSPLLLLVPLALASWGFGPSNGPAPSPLQDPCALPGAQPESLSLAGLWEASRDREPGFRAQGARLEASEAFQRSVTREWFPTFGVDGLWNYGQRTSPGEERALGVGARSDLRLLASWSLVDGGRGARAGDARASLEAARAGAGAYGMAWEAAVASRWAAARRAESEARALEVHQEALEGLVPLVERRVAAGVEADWELRLLEEARARGRAAWTQALEARDGARAELSSLAGRCVTASHAPEGPVPGGGPGGAADSRAEAGIDPTASHPAILQLERLADAREAQARASADQDRWRLAVVGGAGPTRSRAFDPDPVEYEYLVGVSGQLRLDLAGVARQGREAGAAEARALRAEAEALRQARLREAAILDAELARMADRGEALEGEARSTLATLEAARLRWTAGVGGWQQVMQAMDRHLSATLARAAWEEEWLLARVQRAELTQDLSSLAAQLESDR